jgi:hypothetical protein
MSNNERKHLEVESLSIAARTVVLDSSAGEGPAPDGFFELAIKAFAEWRLALIAGFAVTLGTWLFTETPRNSKVLEFLVRPPVDAFGEIRNATDAAKVIESCEVAATGDERPMRLTARTDKNGELIAISVPVRSGVGRTQAVLEAARIVGEVERSLKPSMDRATESIASAILTIDGLIAETQLLIKSRNSNTVDQADTVALLNSQISEMKGQRDDLVRRQAAASRIPITGDVKLVERGVMSAAFIAPFAAGALTFVASAFAIHGFRTARRSIRRTG